jgi:hypothetical protein
MGLKGYPDSHSHSAANAWLPRIDARVDPLTGIPEVQVYCGPAKHVPIDRTVPPRQHLRHGAQFAAAGIVSEAFRFQERLLMLPVSCAVLESTPCNLSYVNCRSTWRHLR